MLPAVLFKSLLLSVQFGLLFIEPDELLLGIRGLSRCDLYFFARVRVRRLGGSIGGIPAELAVPQCIVARRQIFV